MGISNSVKRLTRDEQADETRRRLLAAARRVFLKRGFQTATLAEVAAEAGFTKGAVYSQFEGKDDLFLALLEQRIAERTEHLRATEGRATTARALAEAFAADWTAHLESDLDWTLLVIEFRVHAARDRALNRRYAALHERFRAGVIEVLGTALTKAGLASKVSTSDLTTFLLGVGHGLALERSADGRALAKAAFATLVARVLSPNNREPS